MNRLRTGFAFFNVCLALWSHARTGESQLSLCIESFLDAKKTHIDNKGRITQKAMKNSSTFVFRKALGF